MMPASDLKNTPPPPPPSDEDGEELDAGDVILADELLLDEDELLDEDGAPLIEQEMQEEATFLDDSGEPLEFRSIDSELPGPAEQPEATPPPASPADRADLAAPAVPPSDPGDDKGPGLWAVAQVLGGWVAIVAIFVLTGIWAFSSRARVDARDLRDEAPAQLAEPRPSRDLEDPPPIAPATAVEPSSVQAPAGADETRAKGPSAGESSAAKDPAVVNHPAPATTAEQASPPPSKAEADARAAAQAARAQHRAAQAVDKARQRRARAAAAAQVKPPQTKTTHAETRAARDLAPSPTGDAFAGAQAHSAEMRAQIAMLDGARAALKKRDFTRAFKQAQRYLERYPKGELRRAAFALQLRALQRGGQKDAAAQLAKKLSAQPEFYGRLGEILRVQAEAPLARGRCDEARALLVRALQLKGSGLDEAKINKLMARCEARRR